MNNTEDVKNKLDIVEVIREYIALKPAGKNFQARCPFHNEKSPSFIVSPDKQIWHCFGCAKGGDVFSFVMEKEGLTFPEALRLLARKAGVPLAHYDAKAASQKNRLLDLLEEAADFYSSKLLQSRIGDPAKEYLDKRGIDEATSREWRLGFSPESWDDTIIYLKDKGFSDREINLAGISASKTGSNRFFNRFRGRLMFPLSDINGQVIGFTARLLPGSSEADKMGKYINSPQSKMFDKSRLLYGLDRAKTAIKEAGFVIIVEGQMDVIAAHQYGFKNVVAASGTALTSEQVKLLDRFSDKFMFALDADAAGAMATARASEVIGDSDITTVEAEDRFGRLRSFIDPARSHKKQIKIAVLPQGQDPDDLIRADKDKWLEALKNAKSLMQYFFDETFARLNLRQVDDRRLAVKELLPHIAKLSSEVEQDYWLKQLAEKVDVSYQLLFEALRRTSSASPSHNYNEPSRGSTSEVANKKTKDSKSRQERLSESLLALIIKFPSLLIPILDLLQPEQLNGGYNPGIYKQLIIYYNKVANEQDNSLDSWRLDFNDFSDWLKQNLDEPAVSALHKLAILADRDFASYDWRQANLEAKTMAKELKKLYLNDRLKAVTKLITELEAGSSEDSRQELDSLLKEYNNLTYELRKLIT